jgi:hypothetical protein
MQRRLYGEAWGHVITHPNLVLLRVPPHKRFEIAVIDAGIATAQHEIYCAPSNLLVPAQLPSHMEFCKTAIASMTISSSENGHVRRMVQLFPIHIR